jgi:hypothetical protein
VSARWARGAVILLMVLSTAAGSLGYRAWKLAKALGADRAAARQARARSDSLVRHSATTRDRALVERLRAEARATPGLVVTVALDSGVMTLLRDGLPLRTMRVERATDPKIVMPRGTFAVSVVEGKKDSTTVRMGDGPVVVGEPATPPPDGSPLPPVPASTLRLRAADLKAIITNLAVGVPVYIYE